MKHDEELHLWLRLMLTEGIGNLLARRLLNRFGLPEQIFRATQVELENCVGAKVAQRLGKPPESLESTWQLTLQWLGKSQHDGLMRSVLCLGDDSYPESLLQIEDPPCMLYVLGRLDRLAQLSSRETIAIVGSRSPSPQGMHTARHFAQSLGAQGLHVVSGLAHGIDAAAHTGALETTTHRCPTIAVVGTGLDRVYPRQNQQLARQIATQGLLVSEYPIGTPPMASNFPKRNRLISGLARGVVVVEATLKSGSLITARLANEQGKDVFAIPGSIHTLHAQGCHALIRDGAILVTTPQDILDEWGCADTTTRDRITKGSEAISDNQHPLLRQLAAGNAMSLDELQSRSGLPIAELQVQLLELELEGKIARLPGQLVQLLAVS